MFLIYEFIPTLVNKTYMRSTPTRCILCYDKIDNDMYDILLQSFNVKYEGDEKNKRAIRRRTGLAPALNLLLAVELRA